MAGRITIRRPGVLLPTLSLVILLLVCLTIAWLSTRGVPSSVLRYLESAAAREGVTLKLDALKLEPSRGLAFRAENVRLFATPADREELAHLDSLSAGINATRLLTGKLRLDTLQLRGGSLNLPVTQPEGERLRLSDIHLAARVGKRQIARLTSGSFFLQGIPVQLKGALDLNDLSSSGEKKQETDKSLDLPSLLATCQEPINTIHRLIAEQHWQKEELPSLQLGLYAGKKLRAEVDAVVPRYDKGQFHFREAVVDVDYRDDTILINSIRFRTLQPEATATLQGGYDLSGRKLSFSLESNAALLRMAQSFSAPEVAVWLAKFHHADDQPPHISLKGDILFEPDFSLQSATVMGHVTQQNLSVGSSAIDELDLSFYYNNGNFSIEKCLLRLPSGYLLFSASARDGLGEAHLKADLSITRVFLLLNELMPTPLSLPMGLQLRGNVRLEADTVLTTPPFLPGQTDWQDFVPSLQTLDLRVGIDQCSYLGYTVAAPEIRLQASGIRQGEDMLPRRLQSTRVQLQWEKAEVPIQGGSPLTLDAATLDLHLRGSSISDDFNPSSLTIGELDGTLTLHRLDAPDISLDQLKLTVSHICGLAPLSGKDEWAQTADLLLQVEQLHTGETILGPLALTMGLEETHKGRLELSVGSDDNSRIALKAHTDWSQPERARIHQIHLDMPVSTYGDLLQQIGVETQALRLPEALTVDGECTLNLTQGAFLDGHFQLDIPRLLRTPQNVRAFRGKEVPISLAADIQLHQPQGEGLSYVAELGVGHKSGHLQAHLTGNLNGWVHVAGESSIHIDIIDQLIDSTDAHEIIRDFRLSDRSKTLIRDIDTTVRYSSGIRVDSFCRVELEQVEYLLGAIEQNRQGEETLRRDLGSNPYTLVRQANCGVDVLVRDGCTDTNGQLQPNESRVAILQPVLVYDNHPWFRRQSFKTGVTETTLRGDSVIIDIEHSFVELNNIHGTVYPAYSLGMFYPDLQHYMEDVILPSPAEVDTPNCVFPIYSDCKRPMSGTIRALAPQASGFRFLGTTIPLQNFSGFISLSDDAVLLDQLNARSWGGILNAALRIGITGSRTSFDGYAKATNMDLQQIAAAYGSQQSRALCQGEIRFRSPSSDTRALQAYGEVHLSNGDLLSLNIFRPVGDLISDIPGNFTRLEQKALSTGESPRKPGLFSRMATGLFKAAGSLVNSVGDSLDRTSQNVPGLNHILAYDLQEAYARFNIANGHLRTTYMKAKGYNLNVQVQMDLDLEDLTLRGNIWPRISSLPTIILSPLTFLSDFMVDIIVYGKIDDLQWKFALDRRLKSTPPSATDQPQEENITPLQRTRR